MLFCKVTKSERKNRKLKIENRICMFVAMGLTPHPHSCPTQCPIV